MRGLHKAIIGLTVGGLVGVGASLIAPQSSSSKPHDPNNIVAVKTHYLWTDKYASLKEQAADVDAVILVEAQETLPGRTATSDNGTHAIFFENVQLRIDKVYYGTPQPGDTVLLERSRDEPFAQAAAMDEGDGGAYEPGSTYLLFLTFDFENNVFHLVNDEGRYSLDQDMRLQPITNNGPVSQFLSGMRLEEFEKLVARYKQQP